MGAIALVRLIHNIAFGLESFLEISPWKYD